MSYYEYKDMLFDDNESIEEYPNEWIHDSIETRDDIEYYVYQGVGDNSLVKLLINEEIITEL